ncbi:hypothetical protein RCH06_002571 [Polaromonas sp. CG_9.5]|nr:hypothetical protein [Polaromonas sp. CG_9.5]
MIFPKLQIKTVDEQKALGLAGFCGLTFTAGVRTPTKNRAQLLGPGD